MKPFVSLIVLAGVVLVGGCADPSRQSDAETLRSDLADLPGVTSVQLDYTEPVVLDSGKLVLEVEMADDATADQIVAVTEMSYDAFRTTHHGEEADLSLAAGRTTLALRAFEPEASVDAVGAATRTGLTAVPEGGWATIDLTTQEVPKGDHVAGTYVVELPQGSTSADVPALLESLAAEHGDQSLIGWGAAAADGSSLTYDVGFPPAELMARWVRMQTAAAPLAVRATEDGAMFATGRLTPTADVTERALDRITRPHLRALGDGAWTYDLLYANGSPVTSIDRYLCEPTSEGPYDDELEAWVTTTFGRCVGA